MSGKCCDCRWWDNLHGDGTTRSETHGACLRIVTLDAAEADNIAVIAVYREEGVTPALLETGPDFGCVLFEARDA